MVADYKISVQGYFDMNLDGDNGCKSIQVLTPGITLRRTHFVSGDFYSINTSVYFIIRENFTDLWRE